MVHLEVSNKSKFYIVIFMSLYCAFPTADDGYFDQILFQLKIKTDICDISNILPLN